MELLKDSTSLYPCRMDVSSLTALAAICPATVSPRARNPSVLHGKNPMRKMGIFVVSFSQMPSSGAFLHPSSQRIMELEDLKILANVSNKNQLKLDAINDLGN